MAEIYVAMSFGSIVSAYYTLRSSDSGDTWTLLPEMTSSTISRIFALEVTDSGQTIIAAGTYSTAWTRIVRSTDRGESFTQVYTKTATNSRITAMKKSLTDDQIIWATYKPSTNLGYWMKSTDGGENWSEPAYISGLGAPRALCFIDDQTGWVVGYDYDGAYKTTNGGSGWSVQTLPSASPYGWYGITARDANTAWAVTRDLDVGVALTTDGTNWNAYSYPKQDQYGLVGIHAFSKKLVWAVGGDQNHILIIKSIDGGLTWRQQALLTVPYIGTDDDVFSQIYMKVHFASPDVGWVTGHEFYKTIDGGNTWSAMTRPYSGYGTYDACYYDEFTVEFRSYDITSWQPSIYSSEGTVVSTGSPATVKNIESGDSEVLCFCLRAKCMGPYDTITNIKWYLSDYSDFSGTNSWYCDISSTWTQNKTVAQVSGGTPGTCPTSAPGSPNVTALDGGDIESIEEPSQHIYIAFNIGADEPAGDKTLTFSAEIEVSY